MFVRIGVCDNVMDGLAMTSYAWSFGVGFEHVMSRCGHVLLGHDVQFGFGHVIGQKISCDDFPLLAIMEF